jgi:hypothetical protein
MFLTLRTSHILLAAVWIGATVFMTFLLMPAINAVGKAGGEVMISMNRKGLSAFFGALGGLTVLTGIVLFWRFTSGFEPELSGSREGIAYSIGGLAGLVAVIIGGAVVGRSGKKAVDLVTKAATLPDGQEKGALMAEFATLKQRMSSFGLVVVVLQVVALVAMSIAHYI